RRERAGQAPAVWLVAGGAVGLVGGLAVGTGATGLGRGGGERVPGPPCKEQWDRKGEQRSFHRRIPVVVARGDLEGKRGCLRGLHARAGGGIDLGQSPLQSLSPIIAAQCRCPGAG